MSYKNGRGINTRGYTRRAKRDCTKARKWRARKDNIWYVPPKANKA